MMKKTISTAVALALGATLAFAGPGEGKRGKHGMRGEHGMQGEHRMARLAEKLNLTDAQKAQMEEQQKNFRAANQSRFETYRDTMRQYREAKKADDTARADALKQTLQIQKGELQKLRDAQHEAMLSILTPEQRTQLEALKAERGGKHGKRQRNQN